MKKICVLLFFVFSVFIINAQEKVSVTFKYNFENSIDGYTYDTKLVLQRNGIKVGETPVKNQTIPNKATFSIPKGKANLKATIYALYNGNWEARTKDNNYSYDCIYEKEKNWDKNVTINMTVDIEATDIQINESTGSKYSESLVDDDDEESEYKELKSLDLDKYKSNIDVTNWGASTTKSNSTENYQTALKKLNDYLKTFDNGYYGYFEINDGYLYGRFKSGKYTKTRIADLDKAIKAESESTKVKVLCKNNDKCIFSTYTDSYHDYLSLSQSNSFDRTVLIDLFNDFITAYNSNNSNSKTTTNTNSGTTRGAISGGSSSSKSTSTVSTTSTESALKELNEFLKTFDTRYKGMEIKNGYLYSNYDNSNYSKALISNMGKATYNKQYNYVKLPCKNGDECVYSTITKKYHDYFNFTSSKTASAIYEKLVSLLDNVVNAYNKTTTTSNNSNSTNNENDDYWDEFAMAMGYADLSEDQTKEYNIKTALQNLNDYLPTFNKDVYRNVEIVGDMVKFNYYTYSKKYTSSISINDLKNNTYVVEIANDNKVKVMCKNNANCFSGGWNDLSNHFQFFPLNKSTETTKIKTLLENFINAL